MFFLSVWVPKLRTRGACQAESAEALKDTNTKTQHHNDIIMIRYRRLAWCLPAILPAWRNVVLTWAPFDHQKPSQTQKKSTGVNALKSSKSCFKGFYVVWFQFHPNCLWLAVFELPGRQVRIKPQMVAMTFRTPPASGLAIWVPFHLLLPSGWPLGKHDLSCTQAANCVTMPTMMPASPWHSTSNLLKWILSHNTVVHVDTWRSCYKAY